MLARRKMRARDLAQRIGLSETQLSLLRTGKVRGMRFDTLSKLCAVLECTPGVISRRLVYAQAAPMCL